MFAASKTAAITTAANWIEECFSVYLYTGTGSSQTITNNIDTSTKGGLVWIKGRSGATGHRLTDTVRGATKSLESNSILVQATESTGLTAFGTTGFTIGADADYNTNAATYVSWTFREQAKFFDIVTYTGNGANRTISHNLGSVPGCIIIKSTDIEARWSVYHRSLGNTKYLQLNATNAEDTVTTLWNSTDPTSTVFSLGTNSIANANGGTYVAYLFAHDAGGFGASGSDNVISCGSFTCDGSGNFSVNLGYEPQWILLKATNAVEDWFTTDNMRGWNAGGWTYLIPNSSVAEASATNLKLNATGFTGSSSASRTYIYIAIRRGPMKTPTSGTSVFETVTSSAVAGTALTTGFPVDLQMQAFRPTTGAHRFMDRLRGVSTNATAGSISLASTSDAAETTSGSYSLAWNNTGFQMTTAFESTSGVFWNFRRAPGFFDVVCYTGTAAAQTQSHNLGVAPELMIVKRRSAAASWAVYSSALGNTKSLELNQTGAVINSVDLWNSTTPTSSVFSIGGSDTSVNASGSTYVAYLFATVAGVSKVGSYTGNGSSQTINCGFAAGARFILIKRTDSTGNWVTFDTARGIVSGNDPALYLNSTAAEVTGIDAIDPDNSGFIVNQETTFNLNVNAATYIYLSIS